MTTPFKALALLLATAVLGGGAWYVLAEPAETNAESDSLEADAVDEVTLAIEAAPVPRGEGPAETPPDGDAERLADPADLARERTPDPGVRLSVKGRVVDKGGAPLARAEVSLFLRRRIGGRAARRRGFEWRRHRFEPAGKPVRTESDGTYAFQVPAFERSSVQLAAKHGDFAPGIVGKDWDPKSGVLDLGDLVLETGGTAFGRVMSKAGAPLARTEVKFLTADRRLGRLNGLVEPIRTDELGMFELKHIPLGEFRLAAERPKYITAWTAKLRSQSEKKVHAGTIQLERGAELSGVVVDLQGKPIAGARVEGRLSRGAEGQAVKQRIEDLKVTAGPQQRRGQSEVREVYNRFRGQRWIRRTTKTDKDGAFALDGLPNGALRVDVRHEKFIDEHKDPIEKARSQRVEIRMYRRLAVAGVVVDATSGKPVTEFGIRARRIDRRQPGFFGRPPGRGRSPQSAVREQRKQIDKMRKSIAKQKAANEKKVAAWRKATLKKSKSGKLSKSAQKKLAAWQKRDTERLARQERAMRQQEQRVRQRDLELKQRSSQRESRRKSHEAYLKQRLGSSGRTPGPIPKPTEHAGGKFLIEGLQPGEYVFDVGGPSYASLAAGPFKLERGRSLPRVTILLTRGQTIRGRVLNRANGAAIVGAEVELYLPPHQEGPVPSDPLLRAMRPRGLGIRLEKVRTDANGEFRLAPQRAGAFKLRIEAERFNTHLEDNLVVHQGRELGGLVFQLGPAARVYGKVLHLDPKQTYQVVLASTTGQRKVVPVDGKTGDYVADGLAAGDWYVRLNNQGRPGGMFRQAIEAISRPGGTKPDVRLREGANVRFNLDAAQDDLGAVSGNVLWNNGPARGFDVRLTPQEGTLPQPAVAGPGGNQIVRRMLGGLLRGRTDKEGRFKLELVPPGTYRLEIHWPQKEGTRRSRRAPFHSQQLFVSKGNPARVRVHVQTGTLQFVLTDARTKKPAQGQRILMALAVETSGKEPKTWRELPSFQMGRVRGGKAVLRDVKVGEYEYLVYGGGIQAKRGRAFVGTGNLNDPQRLELTGRKRRNRKRPSPARGKR